MKKILTKFKNLFLIIIIIFILYLNSISIYARENSQYYDISLNYILSNVSFNIYKVAILDENNNISINKDFSMYPVDLTLKDKNVIAGTLSSYAKRDKIKALINTHTNSDGKILYKGLPKGLYLINGESFIKDGYIYTPSPLLIYIDSSTIDNSIREFNLKYEKRKVEGNLEINAYKIWDNDSGFIHPDNIEVQLLKNGEIIDNFLLNENNNWRKQWKNLSADAYYEVLEKNVPNGYTVSVYRDSSINKIINTHITENETYEESIVKNFNNYLDKTEDSTIKKGKTNGHLKNNIPQTGQLWWPIPILLILSIFFIYKGLKKDN